MNRILAMTGAALAVALPGAFAQTTPAPQAPATQPAPAQQQPAAQSDPLLAALQGLQVAILENGQGGVASVESQTGEKAIFAFVTPQVADQERQSSGDEQMMVTIIDLPSLLVNWDGAVVFKTSAEEVAHANELDPAPGSYLSPVFFVMNGDEEAALQTQQGIITPILTSYDDAQSMAQQLESSANKQGDVEIVPIEFATLLQAISEQDADTGYRFFSHPDTVAAIRQLRQQQQPQGNDANGG